MDMLRDELVAVAENLGVRPDVLEKVVHLLDVLRRVHEDEEIRGSYALKGGTALNVFWLPLPRLSVDIDLNFIAEATPEVLGARRPLFEQRITRASQLAGCRVLHSPSEHAGGKFRLRFSSRFGGEQNLELDISYVARVPLFGLMERRATLERLDRGAVRTYTLPELAAGKFSALLGRTVARDRFDAVRLLEMDADLLEQPEFRTAFASSMAGMREDARKLRGPLPSLDAQDIRNRLVPLLRQDLEPMTRNAGSLAKHLDSSLAGVPERLLRWSDGEQAFLNALLDHGELRPEHLTADESLQRRITAQPMLRWKQQNVRQHRGLPPLRDEEGRCP